MSAPTVTPDPRLHVRWMVRGAMPEVLAIEQASFDDPWGEDQFLQHLRRRNCIGMVCDVYQNGRSLDTVVGYMVYDLEPHHLSLLTIAVRPDWRRKGVGETMVQKLVCKLSSHRRTRLTVEVPELNLGAQLFFRDQGLLATRVLRDFCPDGSDASAMEYRLGGEHSPAATVNRIAQYEGSS